MARQFISLEQIAEYSNLALAFHKAAKGKRYRRDVQDFLSDFNHHLGALGHAIREGQMPCGHFRAFTIYDPKQRIIHAACFEDRIFHHAVMNVAGETLETAMSPFSYACRPEKGVHKAVEQVQKNLQRFNHYVKIDIAGYFAAIDHDVLLQTLSKRYKGQAFALQRKLTIKPSTQIQSSKRGVTYCGFRLSQGSIRLTARKKQRFQERREYWENLYQQGEIDALQLQRAYASVHAITAKTDSLQWRRENLRLHPAIEV